jgi:hypothetical protein
MRPGPLVAGLVFIALGVLLLLEELGVLELRPGVLLPILLIALGAAVVLTAGRRS